nr:MAG TPA: protein of unknown function (DUF4736) [Bacteriophage sp.]
MRTDYIFMCLLNSLAHIYHFHLRDFHPPT